MMIGRKQLNQQLPVILLVGLCIFHLLFNSLWLNLNRTPLPWDQAGHTRLAVEFAHFFTNTYQKDTALLHISSYYPPLTHGVVALFLLIGGFTADVAAFPITLYFLATLVGLFLLVRTLYYDEWIALLAAVFFSFFPIIYEDSRWLLLEIPLITFLIYSFFFLYKSEFFDDWLYTFLFAISVSGLLLTKWIGIIFLVIPVIFALYKRYAEGLTKRHFQQIALAMSLIAALTLPWYLSNIDRLLEIGKLAAQGEITDPQYIFSLENIFFYLQQFLNFQLFFFPSLVAVLATIFYFVHPNTLYKKLFGSYIAFTYLIFTLISNKDIRYTIPLLIPFAIFLAYTAIRSRYKTIRFGILFTLLALVVNYFVLSFHLLPTHQRAWNLGPLGWIDYINTGDTIVHYPQQNTVPEASIISDIKNNQVKNNSLVLVGIDQADINPSTLDLFLTLNDIYSIGLEAPYERTSFVNEAELEVYMSRFDFFLIPSDQVGPDAVRHKKALKQIQTYVRQTHPEKFIQLSQYQLKNTSQSVILLKKLYDENTI